MTKMGEFLLLMAQERAAKAGIEAQAAVRHGTLREVLIETADEYEASLIVLGSPAEEGRFGLEDLQEFADELHDASGVKVQII